MLVLSDGQLGHVGNDYKIKAVTPTGCKTFNEAKM